MRRRLYTEHKYVTFRLSAFSRFVATVDFTQESERAEVKCQFEDIKGLMHGHAQHEEERIHPLLAEKGSSLYRQVELDHTNHAVVFAQLDKLLDAAIGHDFYLAFLRFEADNLAHQDFEENIILPELHRLYTDGEILARVDGPSYAVMTIDEMVGMIQELFPHFNSIDRYGMLNDIRLAQSEKFLPVWESIMPTLTESEYVHFGEQFTIPQVV